MNALTPEIEQAVRAAIREKGPIPGIAALRALTGMGLKDAKEWVDNSGEYYRKPIGRCRYCGDETRSPEAQQCRHCLRDWHDDANVLRLGTDKPWTESR